MTQVPADITDFLARVVPFDELPGDAIERLAGQLRIHYFRRRDEVARFDPPGRAGLFIVRKGAVALVDEQGHALEQRGEGELFGHRIVFDPPVDRYTVRTIEDSLVWELEQANIDRLLEQHAGVARFLAGGPGARLAAGGESASADTIAELSLRPPVTTRTGQSIGDCARLMAEHRISCLPVLEDGRLVGIITDRDLRNRVLAREIPSSTPVGEVMTPSPATIALAAAPAAAMVEMMRLGIHHLPVVGDGGELAAVVSSSDLMRAQVPDPLRLVRDIGRAEDVEAVAGLARRGPALLAGLARSGTTATEIGRMAGRITDACTGRLLALAEDELGTAPMAWTWLAFGSQARLEQGLVSDQDNGLLLAEEPDQASSEYFLRLAEFVCGGLNDCGYIFCPGGVMAQGEWRMSRRAWRSRFDRWMREPEPKSVMHCSIFFDMRAVRGDLELAESLHRDVLEQASDSDIFRRFLAAESMSHRPPLGLFRQFVQERGGKQSKGLNLKKRGVIPIVDLARVHALEGALDAVHSEERIQAAGQAGIMTAADADDLIHALRFIGNVRLRHQARQLERGEPPDHLVDPDELSSLHRRYLRSAFSIVTSAQRAMAQHYML
ncbi:putative nucleotidyltransferase substrate binding domain-containing protein [Wenzhouxiangella sp. EGI_FJ10409]|uniref:putative nucleotidyltransferase substrate binding domain-containing protein n=1 Tax=Wenzhouxiangella sp. EGI_FJ10409 TaxID=3243767 RepID=UPI0035D908CB